MDSIDEKPQNMITNGSQNTDIDITFLPNIYEVIRSLERDTHDPSQKNVQSQDVSTKILDIQTKLDEARERICQLPGIEFNQREQIQQMKHLRNQVLEKRQLILKFRNKYSFTKF